MVLCLAASAQTTVRVLVFSHDGASKTDYIERALLTCNREELIPGIRFHVVRRHFNRRERLDANALAGFDVLVISGGWVDTFHPNWAPQDVRAFVASGGGYVGICAGEILAIEGAVKDPFFGTYQGLEIAPAVERTQPEWVGSRNIRFSEEGSLALGLSGDQRVLHWNGSILRYRTPAEGGVFATFDGNGADIEDPEHGRDWWQPAWADGAAIITDRFGGGRVLLSSPHPEHPRETPDSRSPGSSGTWSDGPPLAATLRRWRWGERRSFREPIVRPASRLSRLW